jgi:tripartite-type tricarboxylate transporter receptor subunit TctC
LRHDRRARSGGWRPEKPVEVVVPTGAEGINDLNARLIQKTYGSARGVMADLGLVK